MRVGDLFEWLICFVVTSSLHLKDFLLFLFVELSEVWDQVLPLTSLDHGVDTVVRRHVGNTFIGTMIDENFLHASLTWGDVGSVLGFWVYTRVVFLRYGNLKIILSAVEAFPSDVVSSTWGLRTNWRLISVLNRWPRSSLCISLYAARVSLFAQNDDMLSSSSSSQLYWFGLRLQNIQVN